MARILSNRILFGSRLGFEITGYIGSKSSNTFRRIDPSQITASSSPEGWIIHIKSETPYNIKFYITVKSSKNNAVFTMQPFNKEPSNLDDVFLTLLLRDYRTNSMYTVYHGHIKLFKTRSVELPSQASIAFDDLASSIAHSIKDAHASISQKLKDSSFGLEIGDFEVKIPYVTQVGNDKKLIMKLPHYSDKLNSNEESFSKISFKKIMKLE